jgi:hypothetical protein
MPSINEHTIILDDLHDTIANIDAIALVYHLALYVYAIYWHLHHLGSGASQ